MVEEKVKDLSVSVDSDLQRRTVGYTYDVKVFDDHWPQAKLVKVYLYTINFNVKSK